MAIQDVKKIKTGYSVSIKNIGGFAAPVDVVVKYDDGTEETKHVSPVTWEKDQKQTSIAINTKKKILSVQLKGGIFVDADESNNSYPVKKGF